MTAADFAVCMGKYQEMSMYMKTLATAAVLGLATTGAASAATLYATTVLFADGTGQPADRDDPNDALGAPDGAFYEIGENGRLDLGFGQPFTGPSSTIEITFGNRAAFDEDTMLFGLDGLGGETLLASFTNDDAVGNTITVNFDGIYTALSFRDYSVTGPDTGRRVNGIDIDSVSVSTIPVPAAGLLLAGALGALGLARRRKA